MEYCEKSEIQDYWDPAACIRQSWVKNSTSKIIFSTSQLLTWAIYLLLCIMGTWLSHYRLLLLSAFSAGLPAYSVVFLYSSSNQLAFSLPNLKFNTNIFKPYTKTQSLHSQQITSHLTSKRKSLQAQTSPNCLSSPVSVCACANLLNQLAFFPRISCNSASLPFYKIYLCSLSLILSRMFHSLLCLSLSLPPAHKLFMSLPSIKKISTDPMCWWFIIRSWNPVSSLIAPG